VDGGSRQLKVISSDGGHGRLGMTVHLNS